MIRISMLMAAFVLIAAQLYFGTEPNTPGQRNNSAWTRSNLAEHGGQIHNEGASTPSVAYSLVEDGLSDGTRDLGGNVDADPLHTDVDGADNIPGSVDDEVDLRAGSPAVDAADNGRLPPDRFDLDGDGDTSEPFPIDIIGAARVFDATGSGAVADMGAYERSSSNVAVEPNSGQDEQGFELARPFPNPVTENSALMFRLPTSEHAEVAVYDVLGRKQLVLFDDHARSNQEYRLEIPVNRLTSGVYFVRLQAGSLNRTTNFVVVQ